MDQHNDFSLLVRRVRAGDEAAAEQLVRRYEPLIRRAIRLRIEDSRLNRVFDPMDVSQSVLASFFVRAAIGEYDLENPDQLIRLLVAMARNKLASRVRQERRQQRDVRRVAVLSTKDFAELVDPRPSVSEMLSKRELLERMRAELSEDERRVADLRSEGYGWDEIAGQLGGTGHARRMQLSRGIDRIVRKLGVSE
jgi:RNA polymerase sigma-70 factor (ECF subfamily)